MVTAVLRCGIKSGKAIDVEHQHVWHNLIGGPIAVAAGAVTARMARRPAERCADAGPPN